MSSARRYVKLRDPFPMRHGGRLEAVEIAYETWGEPNPARDNCIVIFTGLSPSAHAASSPRNPSPGWWEAMVGPGKPIDSNRFHVICINSLGSCFGSTGPASNNPATGRPYALDFPTLTVEDIAASAREALKLLGFGRVRAIVGPSLGGMTALAYALLFPDEVEALVLISSAVHSLPFATAIRSLQRELIRADPAWKGGYYQPGPGPKEGMRLARKLGMISYRSAGEWAERFGRRRVTDSESGTGPFSVEFEIEAYLEARARSFIGKFDPNAYLYLSHAMDIFDAAEYGSSPATALAGVKVEDVLVIGVVSDILFPLLQQRELVDGLTRAGCRVDFKVLESIQGHDSFLVDMDRFRPVIRHFLEQLD